MTDDDDSRLVEQTARDLMRQYGPRAAEVAREQADADDELGDMLSAETWRDIADEIERLQKP